MKEERQMLMLYVDSWLRQALDRVLAQGSDRGDVPGWVMITVMTAALVLAILIPFREAIVEAVQTALDSVTEVQ